MTDSDLGALPHDHPTAEAPSSSPPGRPPGLPLAWRAPLLAYAVTLGVGVVLGVLTIVALAGGDGPAEAQEVSDAAEGVLALLAIPFQLTAMALGGRIGFDNEAFSVSLMAPPLLLTATYAVVLARSAAAAESRSPSRTRQDRALTSGAAALGTALVVAVVTRAMALRADGESFHALSVSLVVGTLFLTFVADLVGRELRSVGLPALARTWAAAALAWFSHVGLWLVVSLPLLFVLAWTQEGFRTALSLPLWWPTGGLWTYVMGHLSGIGTSGFYSYAWSGGGVLAPLALLLGAVVATTFASLVWHLRSRRTSAELAVPGSWVQLPAAFAVGGVLVTMVSMVSVGGGAFGVSGSLTVMPAAWTCVLLGLWGLAAEALSRTVAPRLVEVLPSSFVARLRGSVAPAEPDEVATPDPMTPEQARKVRRIALVVGAGLAVLAAVPLTVSAISSAFYSPEKAAQTYVDAVAAGDMGAVAEALPDSGDFSPLLLTEEIYEAATERPTGYEVGEVTILGDSAMVEVEATGGVGGDSYLSLEKGGKKFGLFQEWEVAEGLTSTLNVSTDGVEELTVNGVSVEAPSGGYPTFVVLPGTYSVDLYAGNEWLDGAASEVAVPLGAYASADTTTPGPSDAFTERVDEEIGAWLEECMASTEPEPDGCPQSVYAFGDVRNLSWELSEPPVVDYEYFEPTFPMTLYASEGVATATYEVDESYGFGPKQWTEETEESTLDFTIEVDVAGDSLDVTPETY
ncbi:hypothetical protein [Nocardioides astragali]|uniref:Uncharacterized protein n=1 Tax=Nocardioides astragali TaxID=1776736 RepID=A0ABW2N515_9ACTN|nr:hypothetical protein [Nocardioides astragali]